MTDDALPLRSALSHHYEELIAPLFSLPRRLPNTAWSGHIPFMFALFRTLRPKTYAELGVHFGASLIAAATASASYDIGTRIIGIDTWAGDDHAGRYQGDAIYDELVAFTSCSFKNVNLVRSTFDEARVTITPESVDLLHIDGLHTYEAVRHDFELWLPTVAKSGVVLFHDTAVFKHDFGVWRLWEELRTQYPSIEFTHSHGLGVLFPRGTEGLPAPFQQLIADQDYFHGYRNLVSELSGLLPLRSAYLTDGPTKSAEVVSLPPVVQASPQELQRELENTRLMIQHNTNQVAKIHSEYASEIGYLTLPDMLERENAEPAPRSGAKLSVTAIIPLYNGQHFIEESLNSVLSQTRKPSEILVIDDGSTDGGPELVERLALTNPAVKLLRKPNGGQSSARNFGVKHSTGKLIALLDQDDAWYPNHIERLIRPFEDAKRPHKLGWVYSNLDEIDRAGNMIVRHFLPIEHNPKTNVFLCIGRDMFVLPSASLISREAFEAVGGFDERLIGYEDDDLFFRLFRAGYNNVYLDESLSAWRIYSSSTSYTSKMGRSRMIYARKLLEQFPDEPEQSRYWARDLIAPRFFRNFVSDVFKAARFGRPENLAFACDCLRELLPHMRLRRRILIGATLPLLSIYPVLRFMYHTRLLQLGGRILRYGG